MIDPETLRHGLHGFPTSLQHQPLEVVAGGGALVFTDQGGEDLANEIDEVTWAVGTGFYVHDQTLRPTNITSQELTKYY